jgi:16S rRNA (uracil1498-N3)-methyltransferase
MSKNRLYIEEPLQAGGEITLRGERARYVGRVLRLRPDDRVDLFDGSGAEFPAVISKLGKDRVDVNVTDRIERSTESSLGITLVQGLSRGDRMDHVIQKATEIGVARIIPVQTEYSVVKLDERRAEKRVLHWRGVAASACEQCGRNRLPQILPPAPFLTLIGDYLESPANRIILQPEADATLKSIGNGSSDFVVAIGPEGGFSEKEYEHAAVAGFRPVGFGPRILRTETAAVAVLAALQTLYGDLS